MARNPKEAQYDATVLVAGGIVELVRRRSDGPLGREGLFVHLVVGDGSENATRALSRIITVRKTITRWQSAVGGRHRDRPPPQCAVKELRMRMLLAVCGKRTRNHGSGVHW